MPFVNDSPYLLNFRCKIALLRIASQMFFGGFNVLNGAGLEPLALMREAGKAVLLERLAPEDFDGEFPVGSIEQDTGM